MSEQTKPARKPRGVKKVDDIEEVVVSLAESLKIQPKKPRAKKQPNEGLGSRGAASLPKAEETINEEVPVEKVIETPKTQPLQIIEAVTTVPVPVKPKPKKIFC